MHAQMGILRQTVTGQVLSEDMSYSNFLSGRLLWDSCMASQAAKWLESADSRALVVGLVGADHVKFGCGVPARCAQQLGSLDAVWSVMLNPRPQDTHYEDYGKSDMLTLQIPFSEPGASSKIEAATAAGQGRRLPVLPVADLLWYTDKDGLAKKGRLSAI
mmetsp:Transcript_97068/g.187107  ORF Transcript_97068/g.187107 Transcript_97068/m.187107 type:complete len:160 (-) Transcript_97068:200-679(-)